ncbi:MAG: 4-(cytidine 5'-diphospho)-2-C-methyl-D-erythritol kinase [Candidatus Omnitrophica bacterium]|nr:4-(cytidine 5'-diphospho)-2-C-methyl-D-erythritol kinase [Candidatus Omnitrophota bacterium]
MRKLEIKSPAKVNLYLKIIKKREDGYHEIITLFERIDLADDIIVEKSHKKIEISSYGRKIPLTKNNLAYRAALLLSQKLGKNLGVRIRIFKQIPVGAGLGGGSSNAASVLLGLNRLYELGIENKIFFKWGRILGSDVNFFLSRERFALGYGRGEDIRPLNLNLRIWHLVVYPGFSVSTPLIYTSFASQKAFDEIGLTKKTQGVRILTDILNKRNLGNIKDVLFNSLEAVVLEKYPSIFFWKKQLLSTSAKGVLVSGSGSSVFGIYSERKEADGIRKDLQRLKKRGEFFVVSTDYLSFG